jgi:hypothetical protein
MYLIIKIFNTGTLKSPVVYNIHLGYPGHVYTRVQQVVFVKKISDWINTFCVL